MTKFLGNHLIVGPQKNMEHYYTNVLATFFHLITLLQFTL